MDEYIKRESVRKKISYIQEMRKEAGHPLLAKAIEAALYLLDKEPAADVTPVAPLRVMLSDLEGRCCGDEAETYTSGYRSGHRNGQIELLRYILQLPDGTSEDARKDCE